MHFEFFWIFLSDWFYFSGKNRGLTLIIDAHSDILSPRFELYRFLIIPKVDKAQLILCFLERLGPLGQIIFLVSLW